MCRRQVRLADCESRLPFLDGGDQRGILGLLAVERLDRAAEVAEVLREVAVRPL
jgi:hypothetical protein